MNINDLPKNEANKVPSDFFENQFKKIIGRTLGLENWVIAGTQDIEAQFKTPEGYFLEMENDIRRKLKPNAKIKFEFSQSWQLAAVLGCIVIFSFTFIFLFQNFSRQPEQYSGRLDRLTDEELLAGIDIEKTDTQELTEYMAANTLKTKNLELQDDLNNQEIEETLEILNPTELINDLDIN